MVLDVSDPLNMSMNVSRSRTNLDTSKATRRTRKSPRDLRVSSRHTNNEIPIHPKGGRNSKKGLFESDSQIEGYFTKLGFMPD